MLGLVLLVFAFVCFVLAAIGVGAKYNLVAAGLAFWVASLISTRDRDWETAPIRL